MSEPTDRCPNRGRWQGIITKVSLVMVSNLVALSASATVVLLLPKFVGVEEYAYFQLFLFYASYVGFLHGGWNDGIYLRYGGTRYRALPARRLGAQFRLLLGVQSVISILIGLATVALAPDQDKQFVFIAVALASLILNLRLFPLYLLQATSRINEYARVTILDRLVYLAGVLYLLVVVHTTDFRLYVGASLLGSVVSFCIAAFYCRDVLFKRSARPAGADWRETKQNLYSGAGLTLANVASMLLVGIVRFTIEVQWGVLAFGKVSLLLNVLNLILIFLNAVGIVFFPLLKRVSGPRRAQLFLDARLVLMSVLMCCTLLYYPAEWAIHNWLPSYRDVLNVLPLLFPVFILESKQSVISNTYYKAMRRERLMLAVNLCCVALAIILCLITAWLLKDFYLTVCVIPTILAARSLISDAVLSRELKVHVVRDAVMELSMLASYVVLWSYLAAGWGTAIIAVLLGVQTWLQRTRLIDASRRL